MLKKVTLYFLLLVLVAIGSSVYGQDIVFRCRDTSEIVNECSKRVMRMADRGYPFATIAADSAVIIGRRRVDVYCREWLMQRYRIDNVYLIGGEGVSPYYIYSITGIAPGALYCERSIHAAAQRISYSNVASALQPAEVEFHPGGVADVYMYLRKRRYNAVGASIALNRDAGDGKYFVTGNAVADFANNFGCGEKFYLAWNGYGRRSQMLDMRVRWPYVFRTPIIPDVSVNITRDDTLCLTAQLRTAVGFAVSPDVSLKAVFDVRRFVSNINNADNHNARTALYGIGVNYTQNIPNNWRINIECMATGGNRRIDDARGSVAEISSVIESILPWRAWVRYEARVTALQMYFAQKPDIHECAPIGGVESLRGFMANELRATGLVSLCNTVRFLLAKSFSVQMFYDQAFYRCDALSAAVAKDSPSGFGAGIGISSGTASIDIGWAIGRERGELRPIKNAKTLIIMRLGF
ncbi:MAG: hypothetical protein K6F33_08190 [Bacteroidales bacterium]|nr:hypothetical protein [Bacteroidales bacterium]